MSDHEHDDEPSLSQALLGEEPSLTAGQVVREAQTSLPELRRLWRALGFPDAGGAVMFTQADVEAVSLLHSLIGTDGTDDETARAITRSLGNTMARLADWQVSTLASFAERAHADEASSDQVAAARQLVRDINGRFEQLLLYAWRRHVAVASSRLEVADRDDDPHTVHATVGFVDLVGFTELSNGMEDAELATLVERFESECGDVVASHHGRVVKTLGDSVLFLVADPAHAAEIATTIVERIGGDARMPDVHAGMATGPTVLRFGDVFGPPVNLASRLTGLAQRNRVLCDKATADALADEPDVSVRAMTARQVRGFGPVRPYTVRSYAERG